MITIKSIKPMFNRLVTTMDKYDIKKTNGIIDPTKSNAVKEYQKVLAVGPMVRNIQVGDIVFIDPRRYAVMKHREGTLQDGVIKDNPVIGYKFDIVEIDGEDCLMLEDNDIKYIAEIEEFDENPTIVTEAQINPIVED